MHAIFIFTLFFTAGVALQALSISPLAVCLCFATACILARTALPLSIPLQQLLIACIAFSCGAGRYAHKELEFATQAQQLCNKKISIKGEIISKSAPIGQKATLSVATPLGTILVASPRPIHCYTGDTIRLFDISVMVPENERYRDYLKKEGIVGTTRISDQQKFIVYAGHAQFSQALERKRTSVITGIQQKLSPRTWSMVGPLFFGIKNTQECDDFEIRAGFQTWGLSHYLARSGLHLIIFILMLELLGSFFPFPLFVKHILVASCMGIYAVFSYASISFIRALCMVALFFICSLRIIQYHALHAVALVFCAILLQNPYHLFFLDFQLSFTLTAALILLKS